MPDQAGHKKEALINYIISLSYIVWPSELRLHICMPPKMEKIFSTRSVQSLDLSCLMACLHSKFPAYFPHIKKIQECMPLIKSSAFDHTYQENMLNSINISEMLFTGKSNRKDCYMTESKTNITYDVTKNMAFQYLRCLQYWLTEKGRCIFIV